MYEFYIYFEDWQKLACALIPGLFQNACKKESDIDISINLPPFTVTEKPDQARSFR